MTQVTSIVAAEPVARNQASIAIASDDALMTRAIERLLRKAGYPVIVVDSSSDASLVAAISLLVVDRSDERSTGASASDCWRALVHADRLLWIVGEGETRSASAGSLVKPFSGQQLLTTIQSRLAGQRAQESLGDPNRVDNVSGSGHQISEVGIRGPESEKSPGWSIDVTRSSEQSRD